MIEWAKKELARIEHDEDGMQDRMDANILELLEVLSNQDHSNFSANYVLNAFDRLSHHLPLTPLTGEDDEWNEWRPGHFQNKRYSAVFKDADGKAYNSDGKIFSNDGGQTWFTNKDSRVYISFPYMPPRHPEKVILNEEVNDETEPQGEWITVGLEQGALGVIYRIRKCSKCGWEHSLLIPDDYCPKCGVKMKKEVKNERS